MSLLRPRRRRPEINIVPLIDVMTALIFFFLMTMRFDEMQALDISPPVADNSSQAVSRAEGQVVAAITKNGDYYLNGEKVSPSEMGRRLDAIGKRLPGGNILVVADGLAITNDTVHLVDLARKSGLHPRLITKPSR